MEFLTLIIQQKRCLRWLAGGYMCVHHAFFAFFDHVKKLNINTCIT